MRDLYIALVYVVLVSAGVAAPFIFTLCYVWVDMFYPQYMSVYLTSVPVAAIAGGGAVLSYLLLDRRSPPRLGITTVCMIFFLIWVTLTTTWAEVPDSAWTKWDWASKTILFAIFVPFVIRSRVQIEAYLLTYLFAVSANMIPYGVKAALGGGRYNVALGLLPVNIGLGEGSAMSTVSISLITVTLFFMRHSVVLPYPKLRVPMMGFLCVFAILAPLATVARTALAGYAVVAAAVWLRSKQKILVTLVMAAAIGLAATVTTDAWTQRMETIENPEQEQSAATRLLIWQWVLRYSVDHPLGGGFEVYRIDAVYHDPGPGETEGHWEHGRAFHSMYFEVLAEHGYIGITLFGGIILLSIRNLALVLRETRNRPHLKWCSDLAFALMTSLLAVSACGLFIGIGFQPLVWIMFTMPICLREYVHRVIRADLVQERRAAWGERADTGLLPTAGLGGRLQVPPSNPA